MSRLSLFACFALAALLVNSQPAFAVLPLPKPREDVTKLTKPTVCYITADSYEIGLIDWDGKNDRVWMGDGKARFAGNASWSPDGKRAAVVVYDGADRSYTPYVLDLETGGVQNLLEWLPEGVGDYIYPTWSPDGNWVTIVDTWRITNLILAAHIFKVNVHSGASAQLTDFPRRNPAYGKPSWSPDGKKIAFGALEEPHLVEEALPNKEVYVMDADGSNMVNISNHPKWDAYPAWSPDGRKIVFVSARDYPIANAWDLYMMNPDGSNVERLTSDAYLEVFPQWSPDSKWIVYLGGSRDPNEQQPVGIYRMHVATRKATLIKRGVDSPTWVMAGKSRFLSVDPPGKKKAQWGEMKAAGGSENSQAGQENSPDE